MTVEVRRGTDRFLTREEGRHTRHSFSFGRHYDQDNLGFGPLVCHDDHLVRRGAGFPDHPHRDLEIVTWVVSGAVLHTGEDGVEHRLEAGTVQVQSTGSGIRHAEVAAPDAAQTRFVQAWLKPDVDVDDEPATARAVPELAGRGLVPVVGEGSGLPLRVTGATLYAASLDRLEEVVLPEADLVHAYVATGALLRSSLAQPLEAGDAFRVEGGPGRLRIAAAAPTTLLVWALSR